MHRHMHTHMPAHTHKCTHTHKHPCTQASQGTRTEEIVSEKRTALKEDLKKKKTICMAYKFFGEHAVADRLFATQYA